jgi:hypothetical protein
MSTTSRQVAKVVRELGGDPVKIRELADRFEREVANRGIFVRLAAVGFAKELRAAAARCEPQHG